LEQFYLSHQGGERNLFQIWEGGGARGDSVTPSTYSTEYRTWMVEKLSGELERHHAKGLLSLGCGNAIEEFYYERPVSGPRQRAIITARVTG
jgi:hypothetical protein